MDAEKILSLDAFAIRRIDALQRTMNWHWYDTIGFILCLMGDWIITAVKGEVEK